MVLLRQIPARIISLRGASARRRSVRTLCKDLHVQHRFVRAVDGRELEASNSRSRMVGSYCRLSWRSKQGQRQIGWIRLSTKLRELYQKKLLNVFAVYGCAQSHIVAVQEAMNLLQQGAGAVLVLEDDAVLGKTWTAEGARKRINDALAFLGKRRPDWELLLLGGEPQSLWARKTKHAFVKDGQHLGLRYAERVYQSHGYVLKTRAAAAMMLECLKDKYLVADGALAAVELQLVKKAYYLDPQILWQGRLGSSLLTTQHSPGGQAGWRHAWSGTAKAAAGQPRHSKRRVTKAEMQSIRTEAGASGGRCRAGNGSSSADIQKKEAWLRKVRPSCDQAKEAGISYALWRRVLRPDP